MSTKKTATTRRYLKPTPCPICKTEFKPKRKKQKACSRPCADTLKSRTASRTRKRREFLRKSTKSPLQNQVVATPSARGNVEIDQPPTPRKNDPWTAPVKSEGLAVVTRSVTHAKPLSDLERAALSPRKGSHGLASELPMTGRAAAIRNAVEMELGQRTLREPEPVDEAVAMACIP